MKPVKQNLEIWQGKTYEEPFTFGRAVKDDAGELVDIIATNLSGYTGRMQLRTSILSEDVVIDNVPIPCIGKFLSINNANP